MPETQYEKVKVNQVDVDFVALKLFIDHQWHDIEARQLNLLKLLIDNHGHAVSRNQIMDALWHNTIVSDNSVSQAITQLRRSLGDDKDTPRFIKTVPRVGYQLIAELEFPEQTEPEKKLVKKHKKLRVLWASASACTAALLTLAVFQWNQPTLSAPIYQYESRVTSTPGPENYLRYSPSGRYLAFSQINENQRHMDLAVYDAETQSVHTIKNTGYSEEAPEWSPDGKWLAYFRHDPISCEIRVMSVNNPVETWRLSPDRHLTYCQEGRTKQKLHWTANNTLYFQSWLNDQPQLTLMTLSEQAPLSVVKQQKVGDFAPLLMDIDKSNLQMLIVEEKNHQYQLSVVDLTNLSTRVVEQQFQEYWGLKWHQTNTSFWLGNENLRLKSLSGEQKIVHIPTGFIPDLDLNPVTKQLAHTEGLVNVNLYSHYINPETSNKPLNAQRLSSAARTDILPTVSNDGTQTAFVSYQRRSTGGLQHAEIWLKNKYKKTASLLVNLPEHIKPYYLIWSPNEENLLLGDVQFNLYLINIFSKRLVPIIANYQDIDKVNWSKDGKAIFFSATTNNEQQQWQYSLPLASTELLTPQKPAIQESNIIEIDDIQSLNPSYRQYNQLVAEYLIQQVADELPVDNLQPSFELYRPYIYSQGIYFVIKQGHQLKLMRYRFAQQDLADLGLLAHFQQDIRLRLQLSSSADGQQIVFSKLEGLETDIVVQKPINNDH